MNLGGKGSGIWSMGTEGVLAGGTHSWAGPRAEVISMGGDAREMMMGNQVIAPSRATEAYGRAPPPPLPLPLPPVPSFPTREPNFEPSMPPSQTMRQFTEQVMGDQGSGQLALDFHTPRGSCGTGFDRGTHCHPGEL